MRFNTRHKARQKTRKKWDPREAEFRFRSKTRHLLLDLRPQSGDLNSHFGEKRFKITPENAYTGAAIFENMASNVGVPDPANNPQKAPPSRTRI